MTSTELGDQLARFVWESFFDDLADPDFVALLPALDAAEEGPDSEPGGGERGRAEEELLAFYLWVHTRAVQLGFHERGGGEEVHEVLDHLHRAVFEDMVEHGAPHHGLPDFERRLADRYARYYEAARASDQAAAREAARLVRPDGADGVPVLARLLTGRATAMSRPLRDFIEEVELTH